MPTLANLAQLAQAQLQLAKAKMAQATPSARRQAKASAMLKLLAHQARLGA